MTQYPSISITTFHDVEILVRYFECNRGSYDNVVESWIRDNIGEDKEILSYYSQQMGNTIKDTRGLSPYDIQSTCQNQGYTLS
jgi:hypothetical protein